MEEKHIALCILGIIAIIAVVGLIMLFTAEKTGASAAAGKPYKYIYPGGVTRETAGETPTTAQNLPSAEEYYKTTTEPFNTA